MKQSSISSIAVRVLLSCVVLAGLAWAGGHLDWRQIWIQLRAASLPAEICMAATTLAALFLRPVRLLILLRGLAPQRRQGYWAIWSADIVAMAINSIVPMRAGDMTMAFGLRQKEESRTARLFSIVIIDRLFDLATVIVLFVSALSYAPTVSVWSSQLRITLVAALIAIVLSLWFAARLQQPLQSGYERVLLRVMTPERGERWRVLGHDLFAGLTVVSNPATVIAVLLLSIAFWGVTATAYWFGVLAVWPSASFASAALVAGAVALSFVVPITPGGIGIFQAVAVLALSLFEVPAEPALAFAIIMHAFQLATVLILACIGLLCNEISFRAFRIPRCRG